MTETAVRQRRVRTIPIIAFIVCVGAVAGLLYFGLSHNIVYFRTVSEAVHDGTHTKARFRMAGDVVPGSIHTVSDGVDFQLTDGKATVDVHHHGDPPELFKAGAPTVCEGTWGKKSEFESDRIMIRHGSEYTPPTVDLKKSGQKA